MPTVINGLPAHVLLLHVVVVLIPLGALLTVLSAVWPAARRKVGFLSPLTCLVALIFVPITTHAGEWYQHYLEQQAGSSLPAIDRHAALGHDLVWYAIGLFLVSAAVYLLGRYTERPHESTGPATTMLRSRTLTYAVAVVSIAVSVLAVWWLYRVGDSGAHAVYGGSIR